MILVTGATGNIGSALLGQLADAGTVPVRGLTRGPDRASFPQGVEAVPGDLGCPDSLVPAMHGVRSLFLVPGLGADADVLGVAREAGVEHVVLVSSLAVRTHPHLPASRDNRAVELLLRDSGMSWTVLRPTQFASNALWWAESIRKHRSVQVPYAEVGLPAVHPADIAAVAKAALTEPGHRGRTYALTGPARVTPRQQARAIGAALGEDVTVAEISREEAHRQMAPFLGDRNAHAVLDLMGGDVNDALLTVHDTVRQLTGVPARTFGQWAEENADAFR
ncbi:NAD(P)H-binding protein [Streptomyces griseoincarnatus]